MTAAARPRRAVCALLPVGIAAGVWYPLLQNYFHSDDFLHLYQLVDLPFAQWVLMPFGGHVYLVRNTVFSTFYATFGTKPSHWFAAILLTHLVNVALLFRLLRTAGVGSRLASLGVAWWGTVRVLEGTIGWVAVYGQVLVLLFTLPVVTRLVAHAQRGEPIRAHEAMVWDVAVLCACMAFGIGLGVAIVLPLAALVVLPRGLLGRGAAALLVALPFAAGGMWFGAHKLYAALYEPAVPGTADFFVSYVTVIWKLAPLMLGHLLGAGITALLHPFGDVSADYPGPLAWTLVGVYGATTLAALALARDARRHIAAFLVLAAGCYAAIALGRAVIWDLPLIPVFGAGAARYHYGASAFLAAALVRALAGLARPVEGLARRLPMPRVLGDALLAVALTGLLVLRARSGWTIDHHDTDRAALQDVVSTAAVAAHFATPEEPAVLRNRSFQPFPLPPPTFAGWATVLVVFAPPDVAARVRVSDTDERTYHMARPGSRLAAILAPPPG